MVQLLPMTLEMAELNGNAVNVHPGGPAAVIARGGRSATRFRGPAHVRADDRSRDEADRRTLDVVITVNQEVTPFEASIWHLDQ